MRRHRLLGEHQRPANAGMTEEERKWMFGDVQYRAHKGAQGRAKALYGGPE